MGFLLHYAAWEPTPHSPGVQAVPYSAINAWGKYSIVDTPYVHLWPSYPLYITSFQTSRG